MSYSPLAAYQSTVNYSQTPLNSSATYTGTWERVSSESIQVRVKPDQPGTLNIDFSSDGGTTTLSTLSYPCAASTQEIHRLISAEWYRVRYVNDSVAQSSFDLSVRIGNFPALTSSLNSPYSLDSDSQVVRPTFTWLDISRGLASGVSTVEKFGYSDNIGTSWTPVAMAEVYPTPTSAVSLEFISSSAADALDDVGAHEITVEGLDANWELQTVSTPAHATDGTTAVSISGTWLRVFRAYVSSSGAYANSTTASHVGTITIRVAGGGSTYAEIPLVNSFGLGQTLIGCYTIPSGYTGYVFIKDISVNTGKSADVAFFARTSADDTSSSYGGTMRVKSVITGMTGGAPFSPNQGNVPLGPYVGPTDIGFLSYGASAPTVAVEFEIFLVNE